MEQGASLARTHAGLRRYTADHVLGAIYPKLAALFHLFKTFKDTFGRTIAIDMAHTA
jgi:hypothetical protein